MNYEQKYKEALERARKLYERGTITESLSHVFPELAESKDEKIRGAIIHFISHTPSVPKGIIGKETMLAWLEKQGSTWSEEDELMLLSTIQSLETTNGAAQMKIDWLKNIKQRIGG